MTEKFRVNPKFLAEKETPIQGTSHDCGVFVCLMAEAIADGREFDFPFDNSRSCRTRVVSLRHHQPRAGFARKRRNFSQGPKGLARMHAYLGSAPLSFVARRF